MRCSLVLCLVSLMAVAASAAQAGGRPDFSGTWVEDAAQRKSPYAPAASGGGARAAPGPPPVLVITQTADRITIERRGTIGVNRYIYDLAGKESVNHNGAITHTTKTRWDAGRLVTEGVDYQITSQGESTWTIRIVRRLTPKGEMAVETTRTEPGGEPKTLYQVYRRK